MKTNLREIKRDSRKHYSRTWIKLYLKPIRNPWTLLSHKPINSLLYSSHFQWDFWKLNKKFLTNTRVLEASSLYLRQDKIIEGTQRLTPAEKRLSGVTLVLSAIWTQFPNSAWETLILTPHPSDSCIGANKWQSLWPLSPDASYVPNASFILYPSCDQLVVAVALRTVRQLSG